MFASQIAIKQTFNKSIFSLFSRLFLCFKIYFVKSFLLNINTLYILLKKYLDKYKAICIFALPLRGESNPI